MTESMPEGAEGAVDAGTEEATAGTPEAAAESDLIRELDLLEQKVNDAVSALAELQAEKRTLEADCARLRQERARTVDRISRILDKVDSLGGDR
jgi:predicted nuclease with TOPRIM domain